MSTCCIPRLVSPLEFGPPIELLYTTVHTLEENSPTCAHDESTEDNNLPFNNMTCFCGEVPDFPELESDSEGEDEIDGAFSKGNIWEKRRLNVFFMNTDVLNEWKHAPTVDDIMHWVKEAWNPPEAHEIPRFRQTQTTTNADIRVSFKEGVGCWSMVGTSARKLIRACDKPTMSLDLKGHSTEHQRSLVIHEFGHALGLEHEHQRSDFWHGVKDHLDMKKMKDDHRVSKAISTAGVATFGSDWFNSKCGIMKTIRKFLKIENKGPAMEQSEYDPHSIMHYGFDKDWIENRDYRDMRTLNIISEQVLPAKKYLMGILSTNGRLAESPSELDIETLRKAYSP